MSEPVPWPARRHRRGPRLPSERDWERSALLEPRPGPRHAALIGDGGGLPFPPHALAGPSGTLDPGDPAADALLAYLTARAVPRRGYGLPRKRDAPASPSLDGWRALARTDDEALFGRGRPPRLLTVTIRQDARRRIWAAAGSSSARPLRAVRDGLRASSWRLDPTHQPRPQDTMLRVLVTEQTFASGQRADGRVLEPDLYIDESELVLTIFVTPQPGHQHGTRNPETPVRIALPKPVGPRLLIDGALVG